LSLLLWQDFENFIAELLLRKGWCVSQNNKPPNRGINITTTKRDKNLGLFKYIWITKKYSSHRPVGIKTIRELDYLISQTKASKGVIVTTSRLTKGALKMIEENEFKMFYIDNEMLEKEFNANEIDIADDLPFNSSLFRKIEYCRLL
jgi:restriction endonuclease Mrr